MLDPLAPRPRARVGTMSAGLLLLGAAVAGCSDDTARPATAASTPESPASSSSSGRVSSGWVSMVDPGSGVRFRLPERDRAQSSQRPGQDGAQVTSTRYAASVGDVRLSLSVLTTPSRPGVVRRTVRAQYLPFLVVDTVRGQGATEAGVVSNSRLRGVPYRGFDSQLTFVQRGRRAVWFTRAVELPRAVVVVQAVAYVPPDEDAVDRVRALFRQLTDGLVIPA